MYRRLRVLHRWVGIFSSLSLVLIAATGFLLAIKKRAEWLQPPTPSQAELSSPAQIASLEKVAASAFGAGLSELKTLDDVDRFELHVSKGVFKVTSKENYREVQVHAETGEVVSVGRRNDQLVEQIHDLSFFGAAFKDWLLPVIGVFLFTLGVTGIVIFCVPIYRRWEHGRKSRAAGA